jgi:hypothetical protein
MGTPTNFWAPHSLGKKMKVIKIGKPSMLIGIYCLASVIHSVLISFRFVDRDMFMRYFGGGVGHLGQISSSHIHWHASNKELNIESLESQTMEVEVEGMHSNVIMDSDEELDEFNAGEELEESDNEF